MTVTPCGCTAPDHAEWHETYRHLVLDHGARDDMRAISLTGLRDIHDGSHPYAPNTATKLWRMDHPTLAPLRWPKRAITHGPLCADKDGCPPDARRCDCWTSGCTLTEANR